jgi:PAP2 superfamily
VTAGFIAVSRLIDNRHHPFDVITGSLLGIAMAWLGYRQYFPALSVAEGGRPYALAAFEPEKEARTGPGFPSRVYSPSADLEMGGGTVRSRIQGEYRSVDNIHEDGLTEET